MAFPVQIAPLRTFSLLVVQVSLALAAFVFPRWIVHHCLVAEGRRLLAQVNQHIESALARLNHSLDDGALDESEQLNDALTGLQMKREIVSRIRTWPCLYAGHAPVAPFS